MSHTAFRTPQLQSLTTHVRRLLQNNDPESSEVGRGGSRSSAVLITCTLHDSAAAYEFSGTQDLPFHPREVSTAPTCHRPPLLFSAYAHQHLDLKCSNTQPQMLLRLPPCALCYTFEDAKAFWDTPSTEHAVWCANDSPTVPLGAVVRTSDGTVYFVNHRNHHMFRSVVARALHQSPAHHPILVEAHVYPVALQHHRRRCGRLYRYVFRDICQPEQREVGVMQEASIDMCATRTPFHPVRGYQKEQPLQNMWKRCNGAWCEAMRDTLRNIIRRNRWWIGQRCGQLVFCVIGDRAWVVDLLV
jgi:hypothetical protein